MKLLIVESPNKCEHLSKILGHDWTVKASIGHIRDLPENDLGVDPENFEPQYVLSERGKSVVKRLKTDIEKADQIYLGTDPDREGEAIAWHLKEALGLKEKYHRVTFDAITPDVVLSGVQSPRKIDMQLVRAQEARRVLDRLVGYQVSPVLSQRLSVRGLSAGRVQSIAVRLVAEKEHAILSFRETKHFGATIFFPEWSAEWNTKPFLKEGSLYILDETLATRASLFRDFIVSEVNETTEHKAPAPPFTTSTLYQAASASLDMKTEETQQAAQALFEAGHITYWRTDSTSLKPASIEAIRVFAEKKGLPLPKEPRIFKAKKGSQEVHEAIRPTNIDVQDAGSTVGEKALYKLIWLRAVASQLADAVYGVRRVSLLAELSEQFQFNAVGRTLVTRGWKTLVSRDATEEKGEEEAECAIPELKEGQRLKAVDGKVLAKKTQAPKRYTQATLVKKLEDIGVGRPSTYAAIMKNIFGKGYAIEKGKALHCTEIGLLVASTLASMFGFMEYAYTRGLEERLDDIAEGKAGYRDVVAPENDRLAGELEKLHQNPLAPAYPCPECGKSLVRLKGPNGLFWGCSGFRDSTCKETFPDDKGKPGKKIQPALSNYQCKECGKPLIHRQKKGKSGFDFWGCSGYPACKQTYRNVHGKPDFTKEASTCKQS